MGGFDWRANVKPILPGCPDWCPATHFGYLESGEMTVQMQDGTKKTVKAGETYFVPPGHLPIIEKGAVMVEFAQEQVYQSKEFLEKKAAADQKPVTDSSTSNPVQTLPMEIVCQPCGADLPTKALGPEGAGAKMYITKPADGRTATRIT